MKESRGLHAVKDAQDAGQLGADVDAQHVATLLAAVMDGLQLQFLLDPDAVEMVEPFAEFLGLLGANVDGVSGRA